MPWTHLCTLWRKTQKRESTQPFFDLIKDLTIKAGGLEESKFLRPEKGDGDIRNDGLNPAALQSLVRPAHSLF